VCVCVNVCVCAIQIRKGNKSFLFCISKDNFRFSEKDMTALKRKRKKVTNFLATQASRERERERERHFFVRKKRETSTKFSMTSLTY
jgi:hypothetical protein